MPGLIRNKQSLNCASADHLNLNPLSIYNGAPKVNWDGVETVKYVAFRNWTPGDNYTEILSLKNLSGRNVQLSYDVPKTRAFQTIYPKRVTLSQGVSFTLPINFQPLEKQQYQDELVVYINNQQKKIQLLGLLPRHKIKIEPSEISFGYCAVQDVYTRTFKIRNIGDLDATIEWDVTEPFIIEPRECSIAPQGHHQFQCVFNPVWALVYKATAVCKYGDTDLIEMTLTGTGKYPHLIVKSDDMNMNNNENVILNFGKVPINVCVKKEFTITNHSAFRVPFKVEHLAGVPPFDVPFYCKQSRGCIEPLAQHTMTMSFEPKTFGQTFRDYFSVLSLSGLVAALVECEGVSLGSQIEINTTKLGFGQVLSNGKTSRILELKNQSSNVAHFEILNPLDSPFHFSVQKGTISGTDKQTIVVTFVPIYPAGYYKIVPILIEHQAPVLVEVYGTCHTDSGKPPVLSEKHVENFKRLCQRHLATYPFEMLTEFITKGKLARDENGALYEAQPDSDTLEAIYNGDSVSLADNNNNQQHLIFPPVTNILDRYTWYIDDGYHGNTNVRSDFVTLSETYFYFDNCSVATENNEWQKSLTVTNQTKGKLVVIWMTNDLYDGTTASTKQSSTFSIFPATCEIPPLKSTAFRIIFRPGVHDKFFEKKFEAYAFYKNQRDFSLVPDYGIMLPTHMEVTCVGNTLLQNHEIIPKCELDRTIVTFPPESDGNPIFQTLTIMNTGTTPFVYRLLIENIDQTCLSIKPNSGYINENDYCIIILKFKPKESLLSHASVYSEKLILRLNDREKFDIPITVFATIEKPHLLFPNDGQIYVLPTCIGLKSETNIKIRSLTRSPVEFSWTIDKQNDNDNQLLIQPAYGTITPYEEKEFIIIYRPKDEGRNNIRARLASWIGEKTYGTEMYQMNLFVSTREGYLKANELHKDLGFVSLGTSIVHDLYLTNGNDCLLRYRLYAKQTTYPVETNKILSSTSNFRGNRIDRTNIDNNDEPLIIDFFPNEGYIDGRAKLRVPLRIHPFSRSTYQLEIFYELLDDNGTCLNDRIFSLCKLTVNGVYPCLAFTDVAGSNNSASLSKSLLWKAFNLKTINRLLAKEPSSLELTYAIFPQTEYHEQKSIKIMGKESEIHMKNVVETNTTDRNDDKKMTEDEQNEAIVFNFNAAPVNSPQSEVHLLLENRGDLDTEWSFLFPKDLQCELEYWARTGDFTEEELAEMKLQDNKIFHINPKKGVLKKHEKVTITFTYKHIFAGQHVLPILFKVGRGRQIMLNLNGVSVEPGEKYVHFYSTTHNLLPVELGKQGAPVQQYELWNGGTVPVHFQVDMQQLEQISTTNYGFWVLDCLTPEGTILPQKSFITQWVFNPLEAREYKFNIKVHLEDLEPAFITFVGSGFDSRDTNIDEYTDNNNTLDTIDNSITLPNETRLKLSDRLASLDVDRFQFGNVPLFTKQRRVTFLTNNSNTDSITFIWHVTNPEQVRLIRIQPVRGKIEPKQSIPIKVTFMAVEAPSFHDIDLVCEVYNESVMNKFDSDVEKWENEIKERWQRFEIDDVEYETLLQGKALDNEKISANGTKSPLPITFQRDTPNFQSSTLQLCKTLPPIVVNYELDESNYDRTKRLRQQRQAISRPPMPIPELLHLAFTARTLVYTEYLETCNNLTEINKYFIDTCLGGDYKHHGEKKRRQDENFSGDEQDIQEEEENVGILTVNIDESDTIKGALSDLIRSLLCDRVFIDSVPKMIAEPIPYFKQLQYTKRKQQITRQSKDTSPRSNEQLSDRSKQHQSQRNRTIKEIEDDKQQQRLLDDSIPEHEQSLTWGDGRLESPTMGDMPYQPYNERRKISSASSYEREENFFSDDINSRKLKENPNFTSLLEDIIENTLWNIIQEAYSNEFSLTARPRLIALPPRKHSNNHHHHRRQNGEENQPKQTIKTPPMITMQSVD